MDASPGYGFFFLVRYEYETALIVMLQIQK
jgi:hypothetical protein